MPEEKSDIANIYDNQAISESPKEEKKSKKSASKKASSKKKLSKNRLKARVLGTYYGHPARDMRLICVTGMTGKTTVAHFIHSILGEAGERVAVLASDSEIKTGMLHKFLSDAWKAGANYVIVTAPVSSLEDDIFAELEVFMAVLTDYVPSHIGDPSAKDYEALTDTLFDMTPKYVVLNRDDKHYTDFEKTFVGSEGTITYGASADSNIVIENSMLYKKGSEAVLDFEGRSFTVASFLPGETSVSYMACASAAGMALGLSMENIANGIADYNPFEKKN